MNNTPGPRGSTSAPSAGDAYLQPGTATPDQAIRQSQPPGLFLLFIVEMWERFSYYGMRGLLVLYLVSIIATPELKPGVYTTPIDISHRVPPTKLQVEGLTNEAVDAQYPWTTQTHPVRVAVGETAEAPAPTGELNSPLRVTAKAPPLFTVAAGGASSGGPGEYTLVNSSDKELEYKVEIRWPNDQPVAVTINKATSAVVGTLKPGETKVIPVATRPENGGRGWKKAWANNLYGWYTGMAYLLPILGGLIADRFIGTHRSMLVGGLVIALGHIVLAISGLGDWGQNEMGMSIFIFGLVLIVLGTGHFKPCVSVMVGQLYKPGDPRRDGGFSIFYMGINLGAFLCAFVCGTLGEKVGWHWGFGSAAVGMIAGLVIYTMGRPKFLAGIGLPPEGKGNTAPLFGVVSIALAAGVAWLFHTGFLGKVDTQINAFFGSTIYVALFIAAIVALVGWFVAIQKPGERGPVFSIFVYILFNVFFWMAFEQAGSSLNLFAEENTNRTVGSWTMPTTWFQSVNPLVIILFAPVFGMIWTSLGRRNMNPSQPVKIGLGLLLLGIGYLFMVRAGMLTKDGAKVGMFWLTATYFMHTMGELCLSPTGLSYVTKTAPVRFMSLLMGVWFLSSFVAGVAGGKLASLTEEIEKGQIKLPWNFGGQADFYMLFVVSSLAGALVIFLLAPLMKRLAPEKG